MGGTKLTLLMEEDLGLWDLVKILTVHLIEVGSGEIFICSRLEKGRVAG